MTLASMRNCKECRFYSSWDQRVSGTYNAMCSNPKIKPLIAPSTNESIRCAETREFNFACGMEATWFEDKVMEEL